MNKTQIFERVRAELVESFELDADDITLQSTLFDDLDLDSLDAIEMAVKLQEMTGQRVSEDSLKELRTVSDVIDLAARLFDEGGAAPAASTAE